MAEEFTEKEIGQFVNAAAWSIAKTVRAWIARGVPLNTPDGTGKLPLYAAAESNGIDVIQSLLKAGASPNRLSSNFGISLGSALTAACKRSDHAAIKLFLNRGANPRIVDSQYHNAAHSLLSAWMVRPPNGYPEEQLLESLERLIAAGAQVSQSTVSGQTLLSIAIEKALPASVLRLLLEKGADPNQMLGEGHTVLHAAAAFNNIAALRILVAYGGNVNATDRVGLSPLFYMNSSETGTELLALGANLHHVQAGGLDALSFFVCKHDKVAPTTERISFLLDAGADLTRRDLAERTARDIAVEKRMPEIEALINARLAREAMRESLQRPTVACRQ